MDTEPRDENETGPPPAHDKASSVDEASIAAKLAGHGFDLIDVKGLPPDGLAALSEAVDEVVADRDGEGSWISSDDWNEVFPPRGRPAR